MGIVSSFEWRRSIHLERHQCKATCTSFLLSWLVCLYFSVVVVVVVAIEFSFLGCTLYICLSVIFAQQDNAQHNCAQCTAGHNDIAFAIFARQSTKQGATARNKEQMKDPCKLVQEYNKCFFYKRTHGQSIPRHQICHDDDIKGVAASLYFYSLDI